MAIEIFQCLSPVVREGNRVDRGEIEFWLLFFGGKARWRLPDSGVWSDSTGGDGDFFCEGKGVVGGVKGSLVSSPVRR